MSFGNACFAGIGNSPHGLDKIFNLLFEECVPAINRLLLYLSLSSGIFPRHWKIARVQATVAATFCLRRYGSPAKKQFLDIGKYHITKQPARFSTWPFDNLAKAVDSGRMVFRLRGGVRPSLRSDWCRRFQGEWSGIQIHTRLFTHRAEALD